MTAKSGDRLPSGVEFAPLAGFGAAPGMAPRLVALIVGSARGA